MGPGASSVRTLLPFKTKAHTQHTHTHHTHTHTQHVLLCCVTIIHWSPRFTLFSLWVVTAQLVRSNNNSSKEYINFTMKFQFINFSQNNYCGVHFWYSQCLLGILRRIKSMTVKETERNEMDIWTLKENNIQYTQWPLRQCNKERFPCFINIPIPVTSPWCPGKIIEKNIFCPRM